MSEGEKDQKTGSMSSRSPEKNEHIDRSSAAPDGGWGWMIVAGCFLTTVFTRGVTRCVSIFFVEFQTYFSTDYSATAWIHSLLDCTTMLCAPLGSYIGNRFSSRIAIIIGGLLSSAGLLLSSLATSLEFLYLTLGILTGVGFALSYTPAIAMVGSYFSERKALAYGISMSGSGIGTFILAPAVQLLIERFSWRGALLILGGLVSHLCVCGALMRPLRVQSRNLLNVKQTGKSEKEQYINSDVEFVDGLLKCGKEQMDESNPSEQTHHKCSETIYTYMNELNKDSNTSFAVRALSQSGDSRSVRMPFKRENTTILESQSVINIKHIALAQSKGAKRKMLDESRNSICSKLRNTLLKETSFLLIPDFLLFLVSFLFLAYGCSVPFVYLVPYALGAGVSPQQAPLLVSILGVSGIVGTITFGWIADRKCLRSYRMLSYMLAVGSEGLSCLFLPLLRSFALLVPFSLFYGYFDGAYVALIPVVTSDTVSSTHLTSALGVVYFLHAIPYLISPPIGGWLVDQTGSYTTTFFLSGISLICSAVIVGAVRLVLHCSRGRYCLNCPKRFLNHNIS